MQQERDYRRRVLDDVLVNNSTPCINVHAVCGDKGDGRVGFKPFDLMSQSRSSANVVGIMATNIPAASQFETVIECPSYSGVFRQTLDDNASIAACPPMYDIGGCVGRTIVDDDVLEVREILGDYAFDGCIQVLVSIVDRRYDRDQGCRHSASSANERIGKGVATMIAGKASGNPR